MAEGGRRRGGDLKRAIREVRIAQAEQTDVVVGLREAEVARLELVGDALQGVAAELPEDAEQYLVGVLPGQPPRFWVDATSFVVMGRDKRTYLFQKDSRLGRATLAESASVETIADAVTRYIAERIVEREQALEGDWLTRGTERPRRRRLFTASAPRPASDGPSLVWVIAGFGLGMIAGMFLIVAYAWFMVD